MCFASAKHHILPDFQKQELMSLYSPEAWPDLQQFLQKGNISSIYSQIFEQLTMRSYQ